MTDIAYVELTLGTSTMGIRIYRLEYNVFIHNNHIQQRVRREKVFKTMIRTYRFK